MGFDISGNKNGAYFRNNVWHWRPLWDYVTKVGNLTPEQKESGQYNDGCNFTEKESIELADILDQEINSGRTKEYEDQYQEYINNLPLKECKYCNGTGYRNDKYVKGNCNACNTYYTRSQGVPIGKEQDFQASYYFDEENVIEFAKFCRESGGFAIW